MKLFFSLFLLFLISSPSLLQAQKFEQAGEYLSYINSYHKPIQEDFMTYANAVARGKSARKVESRRKEILISVGNALRKLQVLPPYKGDKTYRDSTIKFLNLTQKILNDDYSKIVDMEAIAEQSYDAMEAYYLAQDMAGEKSDRAAAMTDTTFEIFAKKHNVTIANGKQSDLTIKVKKAAAAMAYQRKLYLIFFKPHKQEAYMLDALSKKDLSGVTQNQNSLLSLAEEAAKRLDTTKAFKNDRSLITVTRELQNFYIDECKTKTPLAIEFMLKEEDFFKAKKAFDAKSATSRTQPDIDAYNKTVADYNKSINTYNNSNSALSTKRANLINKWNTTSQNFLDTHVPRY